MKRCIFLRLQHRRKYPRIFRRQHGGVGTLSVDVTCVETSSFEEFMPTQRAWLCAFGRVVYQQLVQQVEQMFICYYLSHDCPCEPDNSISVSSFTDSQCKTKQCSTHKLSTLTKLSLLQNIICQRVYNQLPTSVLLNERVVLLGHPLRGNTPTGQCAILYRSNNKKDQVLTFCHDLRSIASGSCLCRHLLA